MARETWSEISSANEVLYSKARGTGAGDHNLSVNPEQLERSSMNLSAAVRVSPLRAPWGQLAERRYEWP